VTATMVYVRRVLHHEQSLSSSAFTHAILSFVSCSVMVEHEKLHHDASARQTVNSKTTQEKKKKQHRRYHEFLRSCLHLAYQVG
jgi:hypothetical protein